MWLFRWLFSKKAKKPKRDTPENDIVAILDAQDALKEKRRRLVADIKEKEEEINILRRKIAIISGYISNRTSDEAIDSLI